MVATWVLCQLGSKVCLRSSADHLTSASKDCSASSTGCSTPLAHVFSASYVCSFALFVACSAPLVRCSAVFSGCWLRLVGCLQAHVVGAGCVSLVNLCLKSLMTGFRKTKMTQIRKPIQKEGKKRLLNKLTLLLHSAAINWKSFLKSVN